ncbi:uncharacterized protein OCT59_007927 [Rhizophagus irregularis]|uniref:uncharacterized protein n=1 Tax=Rhizophagus irregularis TaxID=588596 RepID=UPI003327452E|nr:hypothetical protein OCT59_007927 [Rhizophagus irregularis]
MEIYEAMKQVGYVELSSQNATINIKLSRPKYNGGSNMIITKDGRLHFLGMFDAKFSLSDIKKRYFGMRSKAKQSRKRNERLHDY